MLNLHFPHLLLLLSFLWKSFIWMFGVHLILQFLVCIMYYLLIIFPVYSWVYPIRFKYEVFAIFVKFKSLVENMFTSRIKTFQTNEGGEYTNNVFRAFLETHGINHRLTCLHHPEQNGLANASIIILLI